MQLQELFSWLQGERMESMAYSLTGLAAKKFPTQSMLTIVGIGEREEMAAMWRMRGTAESAYCWLWSKRKESGIGQQQFENC